MQNLKTSSTSPYIVILGIAQDGGYPHTGCLKVCCNRKDIHSKQKYVCCLGLIIENPGLENNFYFFDCTPDFKYQLAAINTESNNFYQEEENFTDPNKYPKLKGGFLTHAHIGHYIGLVQLGKEAMNTNSLPIHCMPRMSEFLRTNAPFSQLVTLKNIEIKVIEDKEIINLHGEVEVIPFKVKHRGEFSETCGYTIKGKNQSVVFIPDIDAWDSSLDLKDLLLNNDFLFLDGTFYSGDEISHRNVREIPHPFIKDSLKYFEDLIEEITQIESERVSLRNKINFIHLNHTNPCLSEDSEAYLDLVSIGYKIAKQGDKIYL